MDLSKLKSTRIGGLMSKKWMLISLAVVITLPVMLLIIGATFLNATDLKEHRETIAEHISQATGRQLSLNGELELNISTKLSIVVTDMSLANATWASEPEMLTIKRVEAEMMLLPLLSGKFHIPRFHLEGVKALAETNASGISNWMFTEAVDDEVEVDDAGDHGTLKHHWISDMNIANVEFSYHDGQTGKIITSKLDHARIGATDKNSPTVIDIVGEVNKNPVEIHGKFALPTSLVKSGAGIPIELQASVLDFKAEVAGNLTGTKNSPVIDLTIQVNAANLKKLRQVFGDVVPTNGKIELNAKLKSQSSQLQLSELELKLGKGRIHGWLSLDTSGPIPDIQSELNATNLNIDKLLPTKSKTVKAKAIPAKKSKGEKLFSEEALPFDMLSQAIIKATLRGHNLVRHNRRLKEVEFSIELVDEKLSVSMLKHSFIRDKFAADIVVDASGIGTPSTTITFKVPRLELSELLITGGGAAAVEGPLAIDVFLQGRGNSMAQIMGSLDGNINLLMEQGSANAKALDIFVGGLYAMVGTIFVDESAKTKINCAICDFKLVDGELTSKLAVLDTQYSTVFVDGQVDLEKEQLDIKVSPKAKGVTLSVAYPVHLYGSLSKPSVEIEKTDALLKSGELWANIVYPPSALVKFSDLADGRQNACVSMVAKNAGHSILEGTGKLVGDAVKGTGDIIKDVGSGIGKLFDTGEKEEDTEAPTEIDIDNDDFGMDD
jgi:uncharacterized protein involved in outer membrane biogenesis